jgi:hypothetical protein
LSLKETFAEGDSNAVLLYYNLGKAYIMKGDKEKARRNLETFLSLAASDVGFKDMVTKARREIEILK